MKHNPPLQTAAHKVITDLILTPDKKYLLTGGDDGEAKIWDLAKRSLVKTIPAHKQKLLGFAMSPDGKTFASNGQDQEVKLWETDTGKELHHWTGMDIRGMVFTPEGKHLATANKNTTLYLLECP